VRKIVYSSIMGIFMLLLVSGCLNFPGKEPEEVGSLRILLTDAVIPVEDIQKLEITIGSIMLYGTEGATASEKPPIVVSDEVITVDLLTLIGDTIELGHIEATGTYNQLRIEVIDATLTAINGSVFPVTVNSGSLKINNLGLDLGKTSVLILDFDLSKSLKINGQWEEMKGGKVGHQDKVHMTPVIHVRHGSLYDITGVAVFDEDPAPLLCALVPVGSGDALTTFTHKENPVWQEGEFRFCKVAPGSYTLKFFDNYLDDDFDLEESMPLFVYPSEIVVVDRDLSLGTIIIE
jgi:hypothetical protein